MACWAAGRSPAPGVRMAFVLAAGPVLLGGCASDGQQGAPAPETTQSPSLSSGGTSEPAGDTTSTPGSTDSSTGTSDVSPIDCGRVQEAFTALDAEIVAELDRLEIDRNSEEAFSVTLIVTSQQAEDYWMAIGEVVPPEFEQDTLQVVAYWESLADRTAAIEIADGSQASVRQAVQELSDATEGLDDPELVGLQEQINGAIAQTCGDAAPSD